ncbi:MAG: NUDIX domain-containing protein [Ruminococcaceae bacterium]|nr:NUDIX domain-containing protein [Oscillospiraceae bacterium]
MINCERWDVVNEDGIPTGRTILRGENSLKSGEYHLVVHIWILSLDGKFLIQRRSPDKKLMPGEWAATGGAAITGEDSYIAAHRELFEELGIDSSPDTLKKLVRIRRRNSLLDVWVITVDSFAQAITLQESEVAEACWVSKETLDDMISKGLFHNYGKEYFDTVFSKINSYKGEIK